MIDAVAVAVQPTPQMQIESFERSPLVHYVDDAAPMNEGPVQSEIARTGRLESSVFQQRLQELNIQHNYHRKWWETAWILQALAERNLLRKGVKGLGFAVGREIIPSYLAARGCSVLASDLAASDTRNSGWKASGQWSEEVENLVHPDICPAKIMRELVSFRAIDMNSIPDDPADFDFTWSTCSFEHCGSLELGIQFLENQMKCLRPGGVAVHTTEFNLSSNTRTLKKGSTSIYRLRDIESAVLRLQAQGHHVAPLDVRLGDRPQDHHVDRPTGWPRQFAIKDHMRLLLKGHVTTSIGLIITKSGT